MTPAELLALVDLGEDQDVEVKSAAGGFPKSAWEIVSAFANTAGGYLVLGVREREKRVLQLQGVSKPEALRQDFWNGHNNAQKLSSPLCRESDFRVVPIAGLKLVVIRIPMASRVQRPVYINGNPLTGSYKRNYEGDYRCTESEVRQMLRDASDEPQDALILEGFGVEDLDRESLTGYRNRFASRDPDHPFLALSDRDFLERLGAFRRDRKTGREGVSHSRAC